MTPGPPALHCPKRSTTLQQRRSTSGQPAVPPRRRRRLQTVPARVLQRRAVLPVDTVPLQAKRTAAPRRCCQAGAAEGEPQDLRSLWRSSARACATELLAESEDRCSRDATHLSAAHSSRMWRLALGSSSLPSSLSRKKAAACIQEWLRRSRRPRRRPACSPRPRRRARQN